MAAGGAAAAAALAQAIKASGVVVRLDPEEFVKLLRNVPEPLVVMTEGGFLRKYSYLFGYKGLAFYTRSKEPLPLPVDVQMITARSMWMPG